MKRRYLVAMALVWVLPGQLAGQAAASEQVGPVASPFASAFASVSVESALPAGLAAATAPAPAPVVAPQVTGRSGRTYMIAGAAALVGGLLIGDDLGNLIAAGGVVLAVYGIILYY